MRNVSFREGSEADAAADGPFGFMIGRYALVHQADPVAFVRAIAALRPGAVAAFHEPDLSPVPNPVPAIPAYEAFNAASNRARSRGLPINPAPRLAAVLAEADLTPRGASCERTVGMESSKLFFRWRAATYAALMAPLHPGDGEIDAGRLRDELHAAVSAVHGQMLSSDH